MTALPSDRRALVAVDLGAESCRVSLLRWVEGKAAISLVHRFANAPREADGGLVMRGSMNIGDVEELLGVEFADKSDAGVTTIAGLLSHVSGNVPEPGDKIEMEGFKFEVLESNQRKILRVRVKKSVPAVVDSAEVRNT